MVKITNVKDEKITKAQAAAEVIKEVKMIRLSAIGGIVAGLGTLFMSKINFYGAAVFCLAVCSGLGYLFNKAKKRDDFLTAKYFKLAHKQTSGV